MAADVVVEISIDGAGFLSIFFEPFGPVLQCGFGIMTRVSAGCAMEADINNVARDYAGRFLAGHVMDAKANAALIQQFEGVILIPAFVPKLEYSRSLFGQELDKTREQIQILVQAGRQLAEDRAESGLQ